MFIIIWLCLVFKYVYKAAERFVKWCPVISFHKKTAQVVFVSNKFTCLSKHVKHVGQYNNYFIVLSTYFKLWSIIFLDLESVRLKGKIWDTFRSKGIGITVFLELSLSICVFCIFGKCFWIKYYRLQNTETPRTHFEIL